MLIRAELKLCEIPHLASARINPGSRNFNNPHFLLDYFHHFTLSTVSTILDSKRCYFEGHKLSSFIPFSRPHSFMFLKAPDRNLQTQYQSCDAPRTSNNDEMHLPELLSSLMFKVQILEMYTCFRASACSYVVRLMRSSRIPVSSSQT